MEQIAEGHRGIRGAIDLVAYFFLRGFGLINPNGILAFVATNSVAQGDTKAVGLQRIVDGGGRIIRAVNSMPWPGEAGTEVVAIWLAKGNAGLPQAVLDGRPAVAISAALSEDVTSSPEPVVLSANSDAAFEGVKTAGDGFILAKDEAIMLLNSGTQYRDVIKRYMTGKDLNNSPDQEPSRYVINFRDMPLDKTAGQDGQSAADYPLALEIVRERVKPGRDALPKTTSWNIGLAARWWQFGLWRPALDRALNGKRRAIVISRVTAHQCFGMVSTMDTIFSDRLVVIANDSWRMFCILSSRVHEVWAQRPGTTTHVTIKNYFPTRAFQMFPFPDLLNDLVELEELGEVFHDLRTKILEAGNIGLTRARSLQVDSAEAGPAVRVRGLQAGYAST